MTEEKMAGWHHRLNGHGFGWTLGVGWWAAVYGIAQSWTQLKRPSSSSSSSSSREACRAAVHGVAKSQTRLSN